MKSECEYFEDIMGIPRESGKEEKIAQYVINYAKESNIEYNLGKNNIVFLRKNNNSDKTIILQAHSDKVYVSTGDFDFDNNGIPYFIDGDYYRSKCTSLFVYMIRRIFMEFNDKHINTWIRIDLPNGKHLYIKEQKVSDKNEKESHMRSGKITVHRKRVLGRVSFILTDSKNEFEGFIEFDLCNDNIAKLVSRKKETDFDIESNEKLKQYKEHFSNSPGLALFINKAKRGKGIGKELLYYGLLYLRKKDIDTIEIGSADNDRTKKFYKDNGAIMSLGGFPTTFENLDKRIEELGKRIGIDNSISNIFPEFE